MLDITKSREILYDEGRKTVTLYADHDEANLWYVVPEPRWVLDDHNIPKFSLVRSETNQGVSGVVTFIVELTISPEARAAVLEQLPDARFGQLIWQESTAYFRYFRNNQPTLVTVTPSSYANNQAAFVVPLPDKAAVDGIVAALGPSGEGSSPLTVFYEVMTLSQLRAVEATVKYDAKLARQYEKQVDIDRNVWGNEKSRKVTIKEALQQSDAGDVYIKWGIEDPSAELQQKVNDWAWTTLEGLVQQAVSTALERFGPGDAANFNMSYTGSFERVYKEDSVIAWLITPTTTLPRFDPATWDRVYVEADQRDLATSFTVRQLTSGSPEVQVESVTVQTRYPSGTSQHTGQTTFDAKNAAAWTWRAPGVLDNQQRFNPFYDYRYTVRFTDQNSNYSSDWITTDETDVQLTPGKLAFLTVNFTARNVDFEQVDYIVLDFIFLTPDATPPIQQQITIKDNQTHSVESALRVPSANKYTYMLTYVMKDGNTYKVAPITTNQQDVSIQTPFTTKTLSAWLLTTDDVRQASINLRYNDNVNNIHQGTTLKLTKEQDYQEWAVNVVENPNGFVMEYSGLLVMADGKQRRIQQVKLVGDTPFTVSTDEEWFTVTIDPLQIAWTSGDQQNIVQVDADFYLLLPGQDGDNQIKDQQFTATFNAQSNQLSYYSFLRNIGAAATYYYEVRYHHADGTTKHLDQVSSDLTKVTLPKDGQADQPTVNAVLVPADFALVESE